MCAFPFTRLFAAIGSFTVVLGALPFATLFAQTPDHTIVGSYERIFTGDKASSAVAGNLLLGELNCTSCHQANDLPQGLVLRKQAPILSTLASRTRMEYFSKFLLDPHATKPGTTMPNVIASLPEAERPVAVEAIVNFLASTGIHRDSAVQTPLAIIGENLYHTIGCVACHGPRKDGVPLPLGAINIGKPGRKYTLDGLTSFLSDPLAIRPSGRMPHFNLNNNEARALASFLMKELAVPAALSYSYYEGSWENLPDFNQLTAKAIGVTDKIDLSLAKKNEDFALQFLGQFEILKPGAYTFSISSDDGSRLAINGKVVVDNDGLHGDAEKQATLKLEPGKHAFEISFFQRGGGSALSANVEGPAMPKQPLSNLLWAPPPAPSPSADKPFAPNPALIPKGKEYFVSLGCASCHELKQDQVALPSKLVAARLSDMKSLGGCLAETPAGKAPKFAFNAPQRQALAAAIESLRKPPAKIDAKSRIAQGLASFNCYACHDRDSLGGPDAAVNAFFTTTQPEMGDEARVPPSLHGVGGKLNPSFLENILSNGIKDRPYMIARMPKFGPGNAVQLAPAFDELDKLPELPPPPGEFPDRPTKLAGREMVGDKGYSCVKCHTWGAIPSGGVQAISLTRMKERLRQEWFRRYVVDPPAFRPGTRMPSAWPEGQGIIKKHFAGDGAKQVFAVWQFISDGPKAAMPSGYVVASLDLSPTSDDAVMYRNFIEGAGPRAIGVGYPEKVNLALDANNMRPALIWHETFIDAKRHWTDRGTGFEKPAGVKVLSLVDGAPLAVLPDPNAAWPAARARDAGFQFRGYQLDERQRPTFRYTFADIQVTDSFLPVDSTDHGPFFRRTLTFTPSAPVSNLYFRLASGAIKGENNKFNVDDKLDISLEKRGDKLPLLRKVGGMNELLLPLPSEKAPTTFILEYRW